MLSSLVGILLLTASFNLPLNQVDTLDDYQEDIKTEQVDGTLQSNCPPICTLDQILQQASAHYNVPISRLSCLVRRESTNNPNAVSPSGRHFGYTQFDNRTWSETPYREYSVFNGWANIHAAAYLISIGQANRFEAWRYC